MKSLIHNMIPKISAIIGVLRSLMKIIRADILKLLYNSNILPNFDYADFVYDSPSETCKYYIV